MPRPKASPNKITAEAKEQLQSLIDTVVNRVEVDAMTTDRKMKLLHRSLHYVPPSYAVQKPQRKRTRIYLSL